MVGAIPACADPVPDQGPVEGRPSAQHVQAVGHEDVFAPSLPLQLVAATLRAVVVHGECLARDGLHRAEHHRPARALGLPAILDVDVLARVRRQVLPQARGDKDSVGVGLDDPVVGLPTDVAVDDGPSLHEYEGVRRRPVLGHPDMLARRDHEGVDVSAQRELLVAEHRELVAGENADLLVELRVEDLQLVPLRPVNGHAEQRGLAPRAGRAGLRTAAVLVLVEALLHLLETRLFREALIPVGVLRDALPQQPLDVVVALLAVPGGVAVVAARLRALHMRVVMQNPLEFLEAVEGLQAVVHFRVLVDPVLHRVGDVLVALLALLRCVARPLLLETVALIAVQAGLWLKRGRRLGLGREGR
mmetsp:Transcript_49404/g.143722  ORF Transcript_49404/g.143722 Transcript_49404/m.143722 type:complete len:360 (+) Transcript_49404:76-1155(+)